MAKQGTILVVDDNKGILTAVQMLLGTCFEKVITISTPNKIKNTLHDENVDVVLLDMNFSAGINSGNEGLFWLSEIKKAYPSIQVVLFTAYADIDLAVRGIKEGATDFVVKPWDNAKLLETLQAAYQIRSANHKGGVGNKQLVSKESGMFWGDSNAMQQLRMLIEKVAKTDANLLITGENGTGKEMLAREIHLLSPRKDEAMVPVDMGAITETLFESEAFAALKDALVAYALPKNIAALKRDLGKYRIDYDVWFHESTLHESGAVLAVVDKLLELGACYKAEDGAIMYRSAQYAAKYGTVNKKKTEDGTEEEAKDEVLVRANGIPTYFAADIAYHYNKLATRGFAKAIDVWGADHHGHVARMKGAMDAIGLNGEDLDVVLMQMVNLMRDGQPVRMSKRTGNAITLTDLLEEVPIDSARFLFNMHDAGSGIDFDLDQAVKTDNDNPVYYVQYAHARICSILKKMESEGVQFAGAEKVDATLLTEPSEMDLIRMLAAFPQEIVMAAEKYDPSRINRFVIDLASAFHRFYGNCRIQGADPAVQQARLALCIGVKNVIFNVLTMFKINVPEKM